MQERANLWKLVDDASGCGGTLLFLRIAGRLRVGWFGDFPVCVGGRL